MPHRWEKQINPSGDPSVCDAKWRRGGGGVIYVLHTVRVLFYNMTYFTQSNPMNRSPHLLEKLDEREASPPLGAVVTVDGHALDDAELGEVRREFLLRDVHGVLALSQAADEHLRGWRRRRKISVLMCGRLLLSFPPRYLSTSTCVPSTPEEHGDQHSQEEREIENKRKEEKKAGK